jgi:Fur family zinc uptake transcriptional regulator
MARDDGSDKRKDKHGLPDERNPRTKKLPRAKAAAKPEAPAADRVADTPRPRGPAEAGPRPAGLTKNERLLWDVLSIYDGPLKAYDILHLLKEQGVRAPMTVYRALDGLEDKGLIHKLDAMKAYVRCSHNGPHEVQAFLVCEICLAAKEIEIDAVATGISPVVRRAGFDMHTARLEVRGVCDNCYCAKHNHNHGRGNGHDHESDPNH